MVLIIFNVYEAPQHGLCRNGLDQWYNYDCSTTINNEFPPHLNSLPDTVMEVIKLIYKDLYNPALLKNTYMEKCKIKTNPTATSYGQEFQKMFLLSGKKWFGVVNFNDGSLGTAKVLETAYEKFGLTCVLGLKVQHHNIS